MVVANIHSPHPFVLLAIRTTVRSGSIFVIAPFLKVCPGWQCGGPQGTQPRVEAQLDEARRHRPGDGGGLGRRQSQVDRARRARDPEDEATKEAAGERRAERKGRRRRRRRVRARNAEIVTLTLRESVVPSAIHARLLLRALSSWVSRRASLSHLLSVLSERRKMERMKYIMSKPQRREVRSGLVQDIPVNGWPV